LPSQVHTYRLVFDLIASGRLCTDGLLTHTFRLTEYRQAFRALIGRGREPTVKVAFRHDG